MDEYGSKSRGNYAPGTTIVNPGLIARKAKP